VLAVLDDPRQRGALLPRLRTPDVVSDACPECGGALRERQRWCLECGCAARTRVAPTPRWLAPALLAALVALCALAGAGYAVATLAS